MDQLAKHPVLGKVHVLSVNRGKAVVKATGYKSVPYSVPTVTLKFIERRDESNEQSARRIPESANELCEVS